MHAHTHPRGGVSAHTQQHVHTRHRPAHTPGGATPTSQPHDAADEVPAEMVHAAAQSGGEASYAGTSATPYRDMTRVGISWG